MTQEGVADLAMICAWWPVILERTKKRRRVTWSLLSHATPHRVEDDELILAFKNKHLPARFVGDVIAPFQQTLEEVVGGRWLVSSIVFDPDCSEPRAGMPMRGMQTTTHSTDLIEIDELAVVLGVTKATALRRVSSADFPQPIGRLPQGPLWNGYRVVSWYDEQVEWEHHSRLSPYGPVPSPYARAQLAGRLAAELMHGARLHHRVRDATLGAGSELLLWLDLLEALDSLVSPAWTPDAHSKMWFEELGTRAKAAWRKTAERATGSSSDAGVPRRHLVCVVGLRSDASKDDWMQATGHAEVELGRAATRAGWTTIERFWPEAGLVGLRNEDGHELIAQLGPNDHLAARMPTVAEVEYFIWGRVG
jgi:hypothetical protein